MRLNSRHTPPPSHPQEKSFANRRKKLDPFIFFIVFQGLITVDSDVSCDGQANDVFLSSRYCNVFHRCVSGSRFDIRCARANNVPYDLWWNQQTNLCDWPCRVQCTNQLYGSSTSAQQVYNASLKFFNDDCRAYPPTFN